MQSGTFVGDPGSRSQLPGPMDGSDADPGVGKGLRCDFDFCVNSISHLSHFTVNSHVK